MSIYTYTDYKYFYENPDKFDRIFYACGMVFLGVGLTVLFIPLIILAYALFRVWLYNRFGIPM